MINAGASQSLIKIEAVEIAIIPIGRNIERRTISINLSQFPTPFKLLTRTSFQPHYVKFSSASHPRPLPCLRRSGFAQAGARGEGDNGVIFQIIPGDRKRRGQIDRV
jgi:hypothetical protein